MFFLCLTLFYFLKNKTHIRYCVFYQRISVQSKCHFSKWNVRNYYFRKMVCTKWFLFVMFLWTNLQIRYEFIIGSSPQKSFFAIMNFMNYRKNIHINIHELYIANYLTLSKINQIIYHFQKIIIRHEINIFVVKFCSFTLWSRIHIISFSKKKKVRPRFSLIKAKWTTCPKSLIIYWELL